MTDDSETEINPDTILALIEDENCDDARQPPDEFADCLTTIVEELQAILSLDERAAVHAADAMQAARAGRTNQFHEDLRTEMEQHEGRRTELAAAIERAAPETADKRWPFALSEDEDGEIVTDGGVEPGADYSQYPPMDETPSWDEYTVSLDDLEIPTHQIDKINDRVAVHVDVASISAAHLIDVNGRHTVETPEETFIGEMTTVQFEEGAATLWIRKSVGGDGEFDE